MSDKDDADTLARWRAEGDTFRVLNNISIDALIRAAVAEASGEIAIMLEHVIAAPGVNDLRAVLEHCKRLSS